MARRWPDLLPARTRTGAWLARVGHMSQPSRAADRPDTALTRPVPGGARLPLGTRQHAGGCAGCAAAQPGGFY